MSNRARILSVQRILMRETDEEHPLSAAELTEILAAEGITAERKSLYNDIQSLKDSGVAVEKSWRGIYIAERGFELAELRLLQDAVVAASFITVKKTEALLKKLYSLASRYQSALLARQVRVLSPIKSANEQIYYAIEALQQAIDARERVAFDYAKENGGKRRHEVSPYGLIWRNEKYYLVASLDKYCDPTHFRLDRMSAVERISLPARTYKELTGGELDIADYAAKHIFMFSGQEETIRVQCKQEALNRMHDQFGNNLEAKLEGDDIFVQFLAPVNKGLVMWLTQFGGDVVVLAPLHLRAAIRDYLADALRQYE